MRSGVNIDEKYTHSKQAWWGCRFQTTFLGSRGLTGKLVAEGMLEQEDRNGETLSDVLYKHGYQGSEEALARAAYTPEQVRG